MNVKNIVTTAALLLLLGVAAAALFAGMSYLADQPSIGIVEKVATATPALTGGSSFVEASTPTQQSTESLATAPTAGPGPTPVPYNSNTAMYLIFAGIELSPGFGPLNDRALGTFAKIRANNDKSQVTVIIEAFRFLLSTDLIIEAIRTLAHLTGQTSVGDDWKWWSEWIGRHRDEYPPPSEYAEWKIGYLRQIDGRFGAFLSPALAGKSVVDLTEVEWGGVIPDGIPPLENPANAPADDPLADYLEDDERVIGVSINGEHRAYPLRIVNAHELVNDELGGEPLSLTW